MRALGAKTVFVVSTALLFGAVVSWRTGRGAERRSDLAGQPIVGSVPAVGPEPRRVVVATTAKPASFQIESTTTFAYKRPSAPLRIMIPTLQVNAAIVSVGLNEDRSMEIPGATEAGWYRFGATPGDAAGSAVIAGHVDHAKSAGVFLELRRLNLNDEVAITDAAGVLHGYRVTERFQVDKDALPTSELFRRDGPPVLTLITCGGSFDRKSRTYDDNIVIRATPL